MRLRDHLTGTTEICLVTMPFVDLFRPSAALGLFKAALTVLPYPVRVVYANLLFAERIGIDHYAAPRFSHPLRHGGEWLFAGAAFPEHAGDEAGFAQDRAQESLQMSGITPTAAHQARLAAVWREIRREATAFVAELAEAIVAMAPKIVACTSTFQQHVASLALLRQVKALRPEIITLLGGANCTGTMGVANLMAFPWLDLVFSGEADDVIVPLVERLMRDGLASVAAAPPPGVLTRDPDGSWTSAQAATPAMLHDLNQAAEPDYADYFATLSRMPYRDRIVSAIPLEASRGCWWGCKAGCIFCGLNGLNLDYRAKAPARVLGEIRRAAARYQTRRIEFVDNILNMQFFQTVLPDLAAGTERYNIFFETKANLTRAQVQGLSAAGVRWIQPGIEGLDDRMLKLMHKGTDTATNLQLLKYGSEFGVRLTWHVLTGFPGEQDQWLAECAQLLPLLHHLNPPTNLIPIIFQRFSAFHEQPEQYGLRLHALPVLRSIYPLADDLLDQLTYYFENRAAGASDNPPGTGHQALRQAIQDWRNAWRDHESSPLLSLSEAGEALVIYDTRACAVDRRHRLEGVAADVLRGCEPAIAPARLAHRLKRRYDRTWPDADLNRAIAELKTRRLLVEVSGKLLSLPVPGEIPDLLTPLEFPGGFEIGSSIAALLREEKA